MHEYLYLNFDLLIEPAQRKFRARVLDSPAGSGEASALFGRPFSKVQLENFYLKLGQPRKTVRRIDSPETQAAKEFGGQLFGAVFSGDIYAGFVKSVEAARKEGKGLRIRLHINAPEFIDLPWEFLYDARGNQFIALSKETPIVRYLEISQPADALSVDPPLKILAMISSPEGYPVLDVEREWNNLTEALTPLSNAGLVVVERLKKATLKSLQQRLRHDEIHILHFIGHGRFLERAEEGRVLLEDDAGHGQQVSGQSLGTILHDHRSLRLTILNACEGARTSSEDAFSGVAQSLIQQGLPAAIAMQFEFSDRAALIFSQELYSALAEGYPIDAAVCEARRAIYADGNQIEWGTPVLYMRAPHGLLFKLAEPTRSAGIDTLPHFSSPPLVDPRTLEQLFAEGSAAMWVEEWEKACEKFQAILALKPDDPEALKRLNQAKRERQSAVLYENARQFQAAGDWSGVIESLNPLVAQNPGYKDAAEILDIASKQKQLTDLYAEARRLSQAEQWDAVIKVFAEITSIDRHFRDTERLLILARQGSADLRNQASLKLSYLEAIRAMDAGDFRKARTILRKVERLSPGFRETQELLARAEQELVTRHAPRAFIQRSWILITVALLIVATAYLLLTSRQRVYPVQLPAGPPVSFYSDPELSHLRVAHTIGSTYYLCRYDISSKSYLLTSRQGKCLKGDVSGWVRGSQVQKEFPGIFPFIQP